MARFGAYAIDPDQRRLSRDREDVHLTPKAFDLLLLLVDEAPRVVRKAELHERLWPGTFVSEAALVVLVKEIRAALDDHDRSAPIVRTAHGVGYAFAARVDRASLPPSTVSRWIVAGARRIALSNGENVIGRDPAAAVLLDMPGVSRRHARIVVSEHDAVLEDLGSKNGTTLGEQPLTGRVALRDGDQIQVGPMLVIFHASASGSSTETLNRK